MFSILIGGYNLRHPVPFEMRRDKGNPCYLFLIIKSQAVFQIGDRTFDVSPGYAVVIDKNTPYRYSNADGDYVDDYLRFECSDDEWFHRFEFEFNYPFRVNSSSRYTLYLQQVIWESHYSDEFIRKANVNNLMNVIFNNLASSYKLRDDKRQHHPYYSEFLDLRLYIQGAPERDYPSEMLAENLGLSQSYFQHLYTYFFSLSFHNDLIKMRLEMAKNLLTTTHFTIEHIAQNCGYNSDIHFYRQFKKAAGITPTEYRKLFLDLSYSPESFNS